MKQLASDVGGTFVDIVLWDSDTNALHVDKLPSTRHSAAGILDAIRTIAGNTETPIEEIERFVHGFTIATNAWLERRGARVLLLVSDGFRDVLEIGTQRRALTYSLRQRRSQPLVPRSMVREVRERIDSFGLVVTALSEAEIDRIVEEARTLKPEAIAIGLLFSYLNPGHEEKLAEALRAALPGVDIYVSSQIDPQIEEYPRVNTTATAAYVGSPVREYLSSLREGLAEIGVANVLLMRSDGGIATPDATLRNPGSMLLSGPAGGVIAAAAMGAEIGVENIVTFDMGGTSADFSLITRGRTSHSHEKVIDNLPVRLPMIDIETISAGGGSIAAVDHAGSLHVGPTSAGSVPGPACYDRGGTLPTLTDASLVLGLIDPDDFAGGNVKLDRAAAERAIQEHVASKLGIDIEAAALGMIAVANAHMRQAIRGLTIERGHDVRTFALTAFGGAGPIFAALMAPELGVAEVLIPPRPGVFAALGLLMSDIRHHAQASFSMPLSRLNPAQVETVLSDLSAQLLAALAQDGIGPEDREVRSFADMRYVGQFHDLTIELSEQRDAATLTRQFHEAHAQIHGHADPSGAIEIVSLRAEGVGLVRKASFGKLNSGGPAPHAQATRSVRFPGQAKRHDCPIFRREQLRPGDRLNGPAIVSQSDCTIVLMPEQLGSIDDWGVLHITERSVRS